MTRSRFLVVCALLAFLGAGCGVVLGTLLSRQAKSLHEACAVLAVAQAGATGGDGSSGGAQQGVSPVALTKRTVQTAAGYPLASRVVRQLGLTADPDFARAAGSNGSVDGPLLAADAAALLGRMREVSARENEGLVEIRVRTTDAELSKKLANAFAEETPKMMAEEGAAKLEAASRLLDAEEDRLEDRIRLSEQSLQNIKERQDAAPDEAGIDAVQSAIDEGKATLARLRESIRQLDKDLAEVGSSGGDTETLLSLPSVSDDPRVAELKSKIAAAEVGSSDGGESPEAVRQRLSGLAIEVVGQLETRRARAEDEVTALQAKLAQDERMLVQLTGRSVARDTLERNLRADRKLLESVFARRKRLEAEAMGGNASISVREYAETTAYVPSGRRNYPWFGGVLGFVAALGVGFVWHRRNPFLSTTRRAELGTGLNVVASVPTLGQSHGVADGFSLLFPSAQSFQALVQQMPLRAPANQNQSPSVVLITSAAHGDGKTFVSCSLAAALAQSGRRTLLIDSNLRNRAASQLLCDDDSRSGLTEALTGTTSVEDAIQSTSVTDLFFLPAGRPEADPALLLALPALRKLMAELRVRFDRIVIDAPSVSGPRDTLRLCSVSDASFLVVSADSTRERPAREAVRILAESDAPARGVILNRAQ